MTRELSPAETPALPTVHRPTPIYGMFTDIQGARAMVADELKIDIHTATQDLDNEAAINAISRNFVSDTLTAPTKDMYLYAARASMGDAVYHEPSTLALEAHVAKVTGKEAALFMPSGTMSNQIALRTHLKQPPYSVLCDHRAHIHRYEAGGTAFHSGAAMNTVIPENGHHLTVEDIKKHVVLGEDIHIAPTAVIELENTINGTIMPQEDILAIATFARTNGIAMHLDGARIWHVAAETGLSLRTLLEPFDTASLCFSKGLGAPIGSILVGNKDFIKRARWFRKLFGGGMRQTGFMAAAAAYSLSYNFPKLSGVHALARRLEAGLRELKVTILSRAETCMVFYEPSSIGTTYEELAERAEALPNPIHLGGARLVIHIQTSPQAVEDLLSLMANIKTEKKAAGFICTPPTTPPPIAEIGNIYRTSK